MRLRLGESCGVNGFKTETRSLEDDTKEDQYSSRCNSSGDCNAGTARSAVGGGARERLVRTPSTTTRRSHQAFPRSSTRRRPVAGVPARVLLRVVFENFEASC